MQSLVSEAYFLRSLSYFYLVRIYKDVPLMLEPSENDEVNFGVVPIENNLEGGVSFTMDELLETDLSIISEKPNILPANKKSRGIPGL